MMKTLREVCEENYDIMIDGLTRWDLPYGMRWRKAAEQYRPRWLVDILEPDTEWCGGISEVMRICALASAAGLQVSPHHMKLHALAHLVASQPPAVCPVVENRHSMHMGTKYFEKNPSGHNGNSQIELSDRPGFGIELDDSKIVGMKKIFPAA
jgi:L-rhamnonate dehydratase